MAHEPVEVERRGGPDIGLVIGDLRDLLQAARRARRVTAAVFFEARPFGHVHDDLEFALVVEGEHLDDHQPEVDEAHRHEQQHGDQPEEHPLVPVAWTAAAP